MKLSGSLKFIICILAITVAMPLFAQTSAGVKPVSMDDFNEVVSLWNEGAKNDEYQYYIEKIIDLMSCEIDKEYYPYMLSEMLFFRYFSAKCSSMPVFTELNNKADEIIQSYIAFETNSTVMLISHKMFEVMNRLYIKNDAFPATATTFNAHTEITLPNPVVERQKLLYAIGEAEAMYNRFVTMLANQPLNVSLRFSEEAYRKTLNNPPLVYVIQNEPTYSLLKEAFTRSEEMIDSVLLDDDVDTYYSFVNEVSAAKTLFSKWGIPIKSVLPDDISTLLLSSDSDPFILTCLDTKEINNIESIISYLALFSDMYISRINTLSHFSGK